MRIAQIAPLVERVPPKKYGGTERVVYALTEELVRRGHEVTLFASGDSLTTAKLVSVYPQNLREAKVKDLYGTNIWTMLSIGTAYSRQAEFDIIHDHNAYLSPPTAQLATTPTLLTIHGPFIPEIISLFKGLRKPFIATISNNQRLSAPGLNHIGTIYNGLDLKNYPFSHEHDGYLLFVGRISMEKGVHFAIEAALQLKMPLIIAAKVETVDQQYFEEYVKPKLNDQIRWVGEVDEAERNQLMSRALCFLHPVTWPEPFGLTLIEAMACGCPVVAFDQGSIPEVVEDKKSGFVVHDIEGMIQAIRNIPTISREYCRQYALNNFNERRMADGYEEVYRQIIEQNKSSL